MADNSSKLLSLNDVNTKDDDEPFVDEEGMFSVDDEGNIVNPAAEGSCLMAEHLAETGSELFLYVPDFDAAARQRDALAFFAQNDALGYDTDADVADGNREIGGVSTTENEPEATRLERDDADGYDDEYADDEDEGEFASMSSRVLTDPADWVLETILERRMNKEREGGPWIYRCKWKGYTELTWETREVMEEAGWIPQLDAFDSRGALGNMKKSQKRNNSPKKRKVREHAQLIEAFFAADDASLCSHLKGKGCNVHHYSRMNPSHASRFYSLWAKLKDTHVPTLLFHGTRPVNLPSIYRYGLLAGGTNGIAVANGTAHGNGVYTARTPSVSTYYSGTSASYIICAGLVPVKGDDPNVVKNGDFVVFRDPAYVYSMWIVQFDGDPRWLLSEPKCIEHEQLFCMASTGFGKYALLNEQTLQRLQASLSPQQQQQQAPAQQADDDDDDDALTTSELSCLKNALRQLQRSKGTLKKSALKAQPRKIKDLLARLAKQ